MRLIDADPLLQKLNNIECIDKHDDIVIKQFVGTIIRNEPTIEAAPVVYGEWLEYDRYICNSDDEPVAKIGVLFVCSECGEQEDNKRNFCPNCGAKMDGKE